MQRAIALITSLTLMSCIPCAAAPEDAGFQWTGDNSLLWFDTQNWLLDGEPTSRIPGCGADTGVDITINGASGPIVVRCATESEITLGQFVTDTDMQIARRIILNDDSTLHNPVSIETFALEANATLLIEGNNGIWDRGTFDGEGIIGVCDGFSILGTGSRGLNAWLDNDGTVTMDAGITLSKWMDIDSRIKNRSTWQGQGTISRATAPTADFQLEGGTVKGQELTQGTATGPLRFSLPLNVTGSGTLAAESQDIRISFGGSMNGAVTATLSNDRTILIDAQPGAVDFNILSTFNASGTGQITLRRDIAISGQLTTQLAENSSDGFFIDNDGSITLTSANAALTNKGRMTWRAGTISSPDANPLNDAMGHVAVVAGGNSTPTIADDTTFITKGPWEIESNFRINTGATLRAQDGGMVLLRSNRIEGTGVLELGANTNLIHPIDAPPGFVEVRTPTILENAQIINETGELRFNAPSCSWQNSIVQTEDGSNLRILGGNIYSVGELSFNGEGEVNVEGNSTLTVNAYTTNNIGDKDLPGVFRLGDTNGGERINGNNATSRFVNKGTFALKAGILDIGEVVMGKDGAFTVFGGFDNEGFVETESPNSRIAHAYYNVGGETYFDHNTLLEPFSFILLDFGEIRQQSSTLTIPESAFVQMLGGTYHLKDNNANMSGQGQFLLNGGLLLKSGGGIATVSCETQNELGKFGKEDPIQTIEVREGTLRFTNWPSLYPKTLKMRLGVATRIEFPGDVVFTGPPVPSVVPDIGGTLSLGLNGTAGLEPPTFMCDTLVLGGRIRPGGAEDTLPFNLEANLEMENTAIFAVNIAGPDATITHDQLQIDGSAILNGQLDINLFNNYQPTAGQTFTIATATNGFTGDFSSITGLGQWSVHIDGNTLILTCDVAPTCATDFSDGNGFTDVNELLDLLAAWGFAPSNPADLNDDDFVDIDDLLMLLASWGPCDA